MQFTAAPSETMIKKFTPIPTAANPDPATECGTISVQFMVEAQIGVKEIKKFVQAIHLDNHKAGIMVTQGALSPQARKVIQATQGLTQLE